MRLMTFLLNLMDPDNPYYEENQFEAWETYCMAIDAGQRPYTYYFRYLECEHSQNAIDRVLRRIWQRIEVERKEKNAKKPEPKVNPNLPYPMMVKTYGSK